MGSVNTYSDFQAQESSEKVALCIVEMSKRLMGWVVDSGSVYKLTGWNYSVITSITDSGSVYVAKASKAAIVAGSYYNDRVNRILYLRASDSSNPNSRFLACVFQQFYSNVSGLAVPWDLGSGFNVEWLPYVQDVSQFQIALDNQYQMGDAIQGTGDLVLMNDQAYWGPLFDKVYLENQRVFIYSWNRSLAASSAQLIYRGRIYAKKYTTDQVTLSVKDFMTELNVPIPLATINSLGSKRAPQAVLNAFQRTVYGYLYGHRPTNIDQVLTGYPMTGTVAINNADTALTGTGTAFLTELRKDDQIILTSDPSGTKYTVKTVTSDTAAVLTQVYASANISGSALTQLPALAKCWQNRTFQIAGHALREPITTVVLGISTLQFSVASTEGLRVGDTITVGAETTVISNIVGNRLICSLSLIGPPAAGVTVTRPTVSAAYIDNLPLQYSRDYTYSAANATVTLDKLAELNVAPQLSVPMGSGGSIAFNSTTAVVGTATSFTKYLRPGCWIKSAGQASYFEVLEVVDDTHLTLVSAASYTVSAAAHYKDPAYYKEGSTVLSIDLIGKTADGTTSGALLYKGSDIVKDLLTTAGLTSSVDASSFTTAAALAPQPLGLAIPGGYTDTKVPKYLDVISLINQNIFGSLIQNSNFNLQYSIFSPTKPSTRLILHEADIVSWSIDAKADNIVKTVEVDYLVKEYDYLSGAASFLPYQNVSSNAQYLAGSSGLKVFSSYLTALSDAKTLAGRLGFILEYSASVITVATKMQAATTSINDKVEVDHEKMYQRVGSSSKRHMAAVLGYRKSPTDIELELEDLSNAFARCACITLGSALSWGSAPESQRVLNGYITDSYGMQSNDPATFNNNLIW